MTQIPPAMLPPRRLGWVKDPHDNRDQDALTVLRFATPPTRASNRDLVKIVDQGQLGSCTVNGTGQAIRAAEIIERITGTAEANVAAVSLDEAQAMTPFMSRLFAYYLARAYENAQHEDTGTYIRLVFQVLNKYGFCSESVWPYSDDTSPSGLFARMPSAEAFRQAFDQRASIANVDGNLLDYSRVMGSGEQRINTIKTALASRHLVAFGTPVTEDFCNGIGADRVIEKPSATQKLAGGHAMCLVGYDGDVFDVANSWSESFGDGGFVKFARSYIEWQKTDDLWIVKRAPLLQKAAA
jgi:C1A family cysteine protease